MVQKNLSGKFDETDVYFENKQITSFNIPSVYVSHTYINLLTDLLLMDTPLIAIGIFSKSHFIDKDHKELYELKSNEFQKKQTIHQKKLHKTGLRVPIAITNPLPSYIIEEGDRVI